ncbi:MAG: glutaredoxin family protein [Pseudomonadota bacterium]
MKRLLLLAGCLAALLAHAGTLYRWTDAEGKVHYTDRPPPATAKAVEEKKLGGSSVTEIQLPYATQMAVRNHPVVLYASDCGEPCTQARDHLAKRGIPYAAKNPQTSEPDRESLKKLTGGLEVPVLTVGSAAPLKGYEAGMWDAALDVAGYPKNNLLGKALPSGKNTGSGKQPDEAKGKR